MTTEESAKLDKLVKDMDELKTMMTGTVKDGILRPGMAHNQLEMMETVYGDSKKNAKGLTTIIVEHGNRLSSLEQTKTKVVSYSAGAAAVIAVIWKLGELAVAAFKR